MKDKNTTRAAFAQVDITPDFPTELIGAYRADNRATGILDKLYAQVVLWQSEQDTFCLIAIDNLGLTTALGNELRSAIACQLGTTSAHVMLNFSHTHSAPCPAEGALNGARYFELMVRKITEAVAAAAKNTVPCHAAWALTDVHIAENRRGGPEVDNRLGALKITEAETGEPIAVLLRVSAHANILMTNNNKISADYFGLAREKLGAFFGCPVILLQGAAGNLKAMGVDTVYGGDLPDLLPVVEKLERAAAKLQFHPHAIGDIRMFSKPLPCISDVPTREAAEAIAAQSGMDGTNWLAECERLRAAGIQTQSQIREVQFLKIDEGCFCGLSDELFCELSLEASRLTGNPLLFLNGYTNACTGYLPTKEEWHKGGYETLYSFLIFFPFHGHVMPFRDDTAEQIVRLVRETWDEL